jgi:dihydrofolate synthase/folylpolyglutamate synthase
VAHNQDGIKQVLEQLHTNYPQAVYHFVIGFVKDKDVEKVLSLFPRNAHYYFTNAHIPRALPALELQMAAAKHNLPGTVFDDVNEAVSMAMSKAKKEDVVMVCGSFFIIAETTMAKQPLLPVKPGEPIK